MSESSQKYHENFFFCVKKENGGETASVSCKKAPFLADKHLPCAEALDLYQVGAALHGFKAQRRAARIQCTRGDLRAIEAPN